MRAAIYTRVSTHDQQTIPMQVRKLTEYAALRGWNVVMICEETASGAYSQRPKLGEVMEAARKRRIDVVLVWKLDRWTRKLADLVTSLQELHELGVGFLSFEESLDFTTSHGRAMAHMVGVFGQFEREALKERVRAGIAEAKRRGVRLGRPVSVGPEMKEQILSLNNAGMTQLGIAKTLGIGRGSVQRVLGSSDRKRGRPRSLNRAE